MHLRAVGTSIVIVLLLSTLFAGLEVLQATAVIGSGPLASTSNIRGTEVSLEANPNSSLHADGTTATTQGSTASTSVAGSAKKYVVFRDDDISARSLNTLQAINQVHIDENVPVTLAVIPHPNANGTGNELLTEPLYSYLRSIQGNPLFESLKALNALGFTLYSTSPDDFHVQAANLPGIMVQGKTFGVGWKNDTMWKWRMQNLTKYTDAALDAAAPGDSIVVYYHYWTFNKQDGSPDLANIGLLKQYIEHLKSRSDVLFTTLGGQPVLKASSASAVCAQNANSLDVFLRTAYNTYWYNRWNSTKGWSCWEPIGGILTAYPASISLPSGTIDVFMCSREGAVRQMYYNGTEWSKINGFLA